MTALVPERRILRRLDEVIGWSVIHPWISPLYSATRGRPAAVPELMIRLMLLSYPLNQSERNLYATLLMHAGNLWFCVLDLVKTRNLWRANGVFEDLMRHVVEQCIAAGLVKTGVDAAVDGTQVKPGAFNFTADTARFKGCEPAASMPLRKPNKFTAWIVLEVALLQVLAYSTLRSAVKKSRRFRFCTIFRTSDALEEWIWRILYDISYKKVVRNAG